MRQNLTPHKTGFTLVELALSLVFIAVLSITITLIIVHMISSYQKGLVIKQLNSSGSELVEDFRSAISGSSAKSLTKLCETVYKDAVDKSACKTNDGYNFVSIKAALSRVVINGRDDGAIDNVPVFGAFCSGTYSYIWNSGYLLAKDSSKYDVGGTLPAQFEYYDTGGKQVISDFRLLKILDPSRSVCVAKTKATAGGKYDIDGKTINNLFSVDNTYGAFEEPPVDVLASQGNNDLALYDFTVFPTLSQNSLTGDVFYSGSFIMATIAGGINVTAQGNYCAAPNEYAGDSFDYCAINKFNFASQAVGE